MLLATVIGLVTVFGLTDLYLALIADRAGIYLGFALSVFVSFIACRYYRLNLRVVSSLLTSLAVGVGSLIFGWILGFIVAGAL
jgi:hypothetical protein